LVETRKMSEPHIITLGCRLNTLESEVMRENALASGLEDAIIINTCAVTAEAVRQARQTIRRMRRERPGARIIVTGCAAQLSPAKFAEMPEVDRVVGNVEKLDPGGLAGEDGIYVSDIMGIKETAGHLLEGYEKRTRAFVQVQQGCDHRCTFCIIPFARGPNRSVSIDRIIEQVQKLVNNGYKEIVLTGVDICSYGADLVEDLVLGDLVLELISAIPELPRLRLTSLDPAAMDDGLFALLENEPRFMPHLHLSLQAADDIVLKRMKRRHSRADALAVCERARKARPDVVIGADLIAGFPTETDVMFENTLNAVIDMGLTYLHVFPYSERPGTPASNMPQVDGNIRKNRAARIRAAGKIAFNTFLKSRVGEVANVLVEREFMGHCEHLAPVKISYDAPIGSIQEVRIIGMEDGYLVGDA
jgi:threonylcarbamoyladenosine tRNA methylthiotransferase MtaB